MAHNKRSAMVQLYDSSAKNYEKGVRKVGYFMPTVRRFLKESVREGDRLLDLGCGPGYLTAKLPKAVNVVGVDISPKMLELASAGRPEGTYRLHDYHEPFPSRFGKFDAVVASCTFDFCEDLPRALKNVAQVMKPGARMYFSVNERREDLPLQRERAMHASPPPFDVRLLFWSTPETMDALHEAGLRPVSFRSAPGWYSGVLKSDIHFGYWVAERMAPVRARKRAAPPRG